MKDSASILRACVSGYQRRGVNRRVAVSVFANEGHLPRKVKLDDRYNRVNFLADQIEPTSNMLSRPKRTRWKKNSDPFVGRLRVLQEVEACPKHSRAVSRVLRRSCNHFDAFPASQAVSDDVIVSREHNPTKSLTLKGRVDRTFNKRASAEFHSILARKALGSPARWNEGNRRHLQTLYLPVPSQNTAESS